MKNYANKNPETSNVAYSHIKPGLETVVRDIDIEEVLEGNNIDYDVNKKSSSKRIRGHLGFLASIMLPFSAYIAYGLTGMHEYFPTIIDAAVITSPIMCPFIWSIYLDRLDSSVVQSQNGTK